MGRAVLLGFALAMAVAATPLAAQQTVPDQQAPPPPPAAEPPPPFPHYPAIAPREHDPNWRKPARSHSRAPTHRPAKTHDAAKAHRTTKAHHSVKAERHAKVQHATKAHHATREYFSKRTIRQCHDMTYKQIMAHQHCRTMMKQDLEARGQRTSHAAHKAPAHHGSSAHHEKARKSQIVRHHRG